MIEINGELANINGNVYICINNHSFDSLFQLILNIDNEKCHLLSSNRLIQYIIRNMCCWYFSENVVLNNYLRELIDEI